MITSAWIVDGNSRVLTANGIPAHNVGTFSNIHNLSTILEQSIQETWSIQTLAQTSFNFGDDSNQAQV